jgi:hypothetical protein
MRDNYTNEGYIKEFNNHNINIRFMPDAIANIRGGRWSDIEVLSWLLDTIDCYLIGEEFCLSNYDMGAQIYNAYSDKVYIISFGDINARLMEGYTLKLYASNPTEDDLEKINSEL